MVQKYCCAYGCKSKSGPGTKFYKFPACRKRSREWLQALNRPDILADVAGEKHCLLEFYNVCEAHFNKRDVSNEMPILHIQNKGTNTEKTNMEDVGTSTADLDLKILTRSPIDIIDIPPLPSVVIPAYYVPAEPTTSQMPLVVPVTTAPCPVLNYNTEPNVSLPFNTNSSIVGFGIIDKVGKPAAVPRDKPGNIKAAGKKDAAQARKKTTLRNYRKNLLPTISVQKIQTDCNITHEPMNGETNDTRDASESITSEIKIEPTTYDNNTPEIRIDPTTYDNNTSETKMEPDDDKSITPEIKTEANELILDDVFHALSEREKKAQQLGTSNIIPNITFKLQMNLPFLAEETTATNVKRKSDNIVTNVKEKKKKEN